MDSFILAGEKSVNNFKMLKGFFMEYFAIFIGLKESDNRKEQDAPHCSESILNASIW